MTVGSSVRARLRRVPKTMRVRVSSNATREIPAEGDVVDEDLLLFEDGEAIAVAVEGGTIAEDVAFVEEDDIVDAVATEE